MWRLSSLTHASLLDDQPHIIHSNLQKLAAVVNGGHIYTSTDSGETWTERVSSGWFFWQAIASSSDGTVR